MNKKLIALAVAAALAPAAALADSGNVTIYGQANASIDRIDPGTGAGTPNDDAWRVSSNSSRLGFKGTEDLGNGLSAVWQMETGVSLDSGSTTSDFMMRNSFVGLSSKTAGTVLLGKHDTPYKLGTGSLDIFADTMGDYNAIIGNVNGGVAFDSRLGNVAAYISPTWSGFHFAGAVVMANENNTTANADGSAYSLTGVYNNGPLFASLSYEQAKDVNASSTNVAPAALAATLAAAEKATGTKLGLGYNFGAATVGFIAERIKIDPVALGALDLNGDGSSFRRNAYYLNGSFKMGNNVLKAAYGKSGALSCTDCGNTDGKQITVGIDHNLSKRTVAYALYSKMSNGNDGAYGLGGNGAGGAFSPAAAGQDPSVISLGMKHSF
jgi:predicted porin